jgi:hypothetical protein
VHGELHELPSQNKGIRRRITEAAVLLIGFMARRFQRRLQDRRKFCLLTRVQGVPGLKKNSVLLYLNF